MLATLKDAENNLTTYEYDGFDRVAKTRYPSTTKGSGTSSTTDYEQPTYDANSNVTALRNRAAQSIGLTYDNLNRMALKDLPGTEPDVTYAYDNLDRPISASQTGNALAFTYDALSRNLTQTGPQGTVTSAWDLAGRRIQLTYPGSGLYVNTDYLVTGEATAIRENGAVSGVGVLATYAYDDLGNRTSVTFGNGVVQAYTFDPVSRLASLTNNLTGTTNDLTISPIAYNPASQIASNVRTGDAYAWTDHYNVNRAYTSNGLNQHATAGPAAFTYDAKGNLTSDGTNIFSYSSENLLTSATVGTAATLAYDPALRLYQVAGAATTRFAYDGAGMIAEYNGSNALQRRYVFGPGTDAPIVQYEGAGTTDRRFMSADERGSIIALTDSSGALINLNRYDEYGTPQTTNAGRFGYTGQAWIAELGMNYYKARIYSPTLGRFLQTDPIGTKGGINLYAYVGNDPVNLADPTGLLVTCTGSLIPQTSCGMTPGWGCIGNCANYQSPEESPSVTADPLGLGLSSCGKGATPNDCAIEFISALSGPNTTGQIPSDIINTSPEFQTGSNTIFTYQIVNQFGSILVGNLWTLENITFVSSSSASTPTIIRQEDWGYTPNGIFRDQVFGKPSPNYYSITVRQTFTVLYEGTFYPLSTVFYHTTTNYSSSHQVNRVYRVYEEPSGF